MRSVEEEHLRSSWHLILLLWSRSLLIELYSAYRAAVMLLEPLLNARSIEGVLAGQLATLLAILALLEADVAVTLLALVFLGQVPNIFLGAAGRARSILSHGESFSEEAAHHCGWVERHASLSRRAIPLWHAEQAAKSSTSEERVHRCKRILAMEWSFLLGVSLWLRLRICLLLSLSLSLGSWLVHLCRSLWELCTAHLLTNLTIWAVCDRDRLAPATSRAVSLLEHLLSAALVAHLWHSKRALGLMAAHHLLHLGHLRKLLELLMLVVHLRSRLRLRLHAGLLRSWLRLGHRSILVLFVGFLLFDEAALAVGTGKA